jgi:protein O-GlcNAc transferase
LNSQEPLKIAGRRHQTGQLSEAESLYRQILSLDPYNADAWHLLGVIKYQTNRHQQAVDSIQKAIQIRPAAIYYNSLGSAFMELG